MHQPASIVAGLLLRRGFAMLATAGLACLASASEVGAQTVRYTVTDLGTIPGSTVCPCFFGTGLNNHGEVVGRFFGANGRYHGFLWRDGVMIDIGSLGAGITQVHDINDDGLATGNSGLSSGEDHAFIFQAGAGGGQMFDLGTLGGTHSVGYAINAAGVVAGTAETRGSNGNGPQSLQRAALWGPDRRAIDLGTLGGEFSQANGINDAGHVVGWAWNPARNPRAFLWRPGAGMIDLGDLGGPGLISARDISNAGIIVGSAAAPGQPFGDAHAFRWEAGVMTDLGVLPEAGQQGPYGPELVSTAASAVNSAGTIVGNSFPGTPEPPLRPGPFVWQNGVMTNLNDLIPPGWTMTEANDINEHGQIVGTAITSASAFRFRAVLLTPITCYANCDGSSAAPVLNVGDFICFQSRFAAADPYADCDRSSSFTVNDFICFQSSFAAGCP